MSKASGELTGKRKKFVAEYIICLNGTEAARRAGYKGEDATLAVTASRLLRNANVIHAINAALENFAMPANEVLIHLTDIARGDLSDALNPFGGIDPAEARRRGKSHLIKRFKVKTTIIPGKDGDDGMEIHETEIEMYDRLRGLEMLAKYHDLVNRVKIDDWRYQAIADIRAGRLTIEQVIEAFGSEQDAQQAFGDLATQLFAGRGISVQVSEGETGE